MENCRKEEDSGTHGNPLWTAWTETAPAGDSELSQTNATYCLFPVLQSLTKLFSLSENPLVKC